MNIKICVNVTCYEIGLSQCYMIDISFVLGTAKTYDPDSDMAAVVGVPVYYSERNLKLIRLV